MKTFYSTTLFALMLLTFTTILPAQERWTRLVDLRGHWQFEIGDDLNWALPDFDDSGWAKVFVPSSWEDEGFPGYDGIAWYRKRFQLPPGDYQSCLYLLLGRVDDADETYINGFLIGFSGIFPPKPETAYQVFRRYIIPREYLNPSGENVIAIRVYDKRLAGGILEGKVGIFEFISDLKFAVPLEGVWKFSTGDRDKWKEKDFDDSNWKNIIVPLRWDFQGYRDYDGFAWYRRRFFLPAEYKNQQLILFLGKIDDIDETYLNGEFIGRTGSMGDDFGFSRIKGDEWLKVRAYQMPPGKLLYGRENVIAVRVYDGLVDGGIYEGPVGIITRERYTQWQQSRKKGKSIWDYFDAWFKN
jgi:sialate O-acetylesterase